MSMTVLEETVPMDTTDMLLHQIVSIALHYSLNKKKLHLKSIDQQHSLLDKKQKLQDIQNNLM
jgi:hypothetical protein